MPAIDTLRVKQGTVLLDRASSITKAFFTFLKAAVDEAYLENSPTFMSRYETWCETHTNDDLAELRRDLVVVQSVLLSSRSVSVNEPVTGEKAYEWGILWNRTHKRSYDMSSGTLSIISSSRYSCKRHGGPTLLSNKPDESEVTQKDIRIRFHPTPGPTSTPIAAQASIRQLYNNQGTWNSIPRFSVHNILPRTSRIFQIVSEGQLAELQRMLWSREAFLWDQDEDGRSLLFYGNEQPEMCRFLLEHGADVDHVAPVRDAVPEELERFVSAITALRNDHEIGRERLEPILECRKLLLQAGCDPSWKEDPFDDYDTNPLAEMFRHGVLDAMRICFDYSGGLLSPEVVIEILYGYTPLLSYCCGGSGNQGPTIEGFTLLLNRGADISTRDSQGNSCLHLCLENVNSDAAFWPSGAETAGQYLERVRLSLGYLIQHGAEVHAINNDGLSVSDISYEDNVRGHLWDVVLADCGLDVTKFRTVEYCWQPCRVKRTRVGTTLAEGTQKTTSCRSGRERSISALTTKKLSGLDSMTSCTRTP
ncbi:hypothetical protein QBC37DRAFT_55942 [Rhypophila decipiens]|uniref:Uncharacterized protein n=1 Tax=Rhypophila decipiens TaxID=261697 RepID=A0AAN6Y0N3_9PEZI|nr:hypothetical protein QBC37DRAFT_55942 [Rhypophila decipiens]